jgi:hypothetical protein
VPGAPPTNRHGTAKDSQHSCVTVLADVLESVDKTGDSAACVVRHRVRRLLGRVERRHEYRRQQWLAQPGVFADSGLRVTPNGSGR